MSEHTLDGSVPQPYWDNSVSPRISIDSGDTVIFDCPEPCGQVNMEWNSDDLAKINFDLIHALVGSVFIKGAHPGDTLQVEVLDLQHKGWGWTGHLQGFGLLADEFDFAFIHHWTLTEDACTFGIQDIQVPFRPFCGTMGVAPRESGRLSTLPPRANAGNLDIPDLVPGSIAWFPVFVEGALFACGDCHSAQGNGEVCGTAIESPMLVRLRFKVRKDVRVDEVQFETPRRSHRQDDKGYRVTTAHGPDLMQNAKNAIRYMIGWLTEAHALSRSQAYILCSVAADLKISEIVDAPNWIVSAHLPLSIFPE